MHAMTRTAVATRLVVRLIGVARQADGTRGPKREHGSVGVTSRTGAPEMHLLAPMSRESLMARTAVSRFRVVGDVTTATLRRRREGHGRRVAFRARHRGVGFVRERERSRHCCRGRRGPNGDSLRARRQPRGSVAVHARGRPAPERADSVLVMAALAVAYRAQRDRAVRRAGRAMTIRA